MPGTIAKRSPEQVTSTAVSDLTGAERAVALYVSDMPNQRRSWSAEQVRTWIAQGVARLGREELRRRAEFHRGHRLLDRSGLVTAQIQARHEQHFPRPRRLVTAEQKSANSVFGDGMSESARARNGNARVDGDCPCRGTRSIPFPDPDPDLSYDLACPVHAAAYVCEHIGSYTTTAARTTSRDAAEFWGVEA